MSTVTQTLAIPYTGPFNLLFYQLQKLTGAYSERNVCDLKMFVIFFITTYGLQGTSEWKLLCSEVPQFVLYFVALIN